MMRVLGYLLVSLAVLGVLAALVAVRHPDPNPSLVNLIQSGVLFGYAPSAAGQATASTSDVAAAARQELEGFLDRLRSGQGVATEGLTEEPMAGPTLTLGVALLALSTVGLLGGAMLVFGRR